MAITNAAYADHAGAAPGNPQPSVVITLDLDASYPLTADDGYADFKATVLAATDLAAAVGKDMTILSVQQNNFPTAVLAKYDRALDVLKCYNEALVEYANASDLSGCVGLELVVFYK